MTRKRKMSGKLLHDLQCLRGYGLRICRGHGALPVICIFLIWIVGCDVASRLGGGPFEPKSGDLLFQDVDCGKMCDAIEAVTVGFHGAHFSHAGIVAENESGKPVVIEAVAAGVVMTDLQKFLERSLDNEGHPKVVVGRLKKPYRHLVPRAVREGIALTGKPYDTKFVIGDEDYYCSELIYEVFRRANDGRALFLLEPMTFKGRDGGQILPIWRDYFQQLGIDVPEGQPGINPGGISRASILDIIYLYSKSHSGQ